MSARVRNWDVLIAIPLYHISSLAQHRQIDEAFAGEELRMLERGRSWDTDAPSVFDAVRSALSVENYPFEEIHGARAYTRDDLRQFLVILEAQYSRKLGARGRTE